ncbi:intraflagellar transport protein 57 homolog isoform X1 [Nilaparvata lugens]|uniref:intraflagellar transport protein 57 homolog isoform X1 n=1 Tax=Nilaparvata lugens TaxID=108931 RepID=UPI00193E4D64|nr:intraflagellar transport protein 57 homolog isoform X1 [Nilaparvata lugens]
MAVEKDFREQMQLDSPSTSMLREQMSSRGSTVDETPEQLFQSSFQVMEELIDKLKVLNYDEEFLKELKMRPIHKHYFALQTNAGEQFFLFTVLSAWLLRKLGLKFEQPQEYDDPNSTIASILDATRELGIVVDFPPNKLKQGSGKYAIYILNALADKALSHLKFVWKKPRPPAEVEDEDSNGEDDYELLLERVEEEMAGEDSEEDEDNLLHIDDLHNIASAHKIMDLQKPEEILESNTNLEEWHLELERVLPHLKVTIKSDSRDWRSHLEQMKQHRAGMEETLGSAKFQLERLEKEITGTLEKVKSREKFLNSQLENLLSQYRTAQDELARVTEQYREVSGGVNDRQRQLTRLTDELDLIKQEMEERGSTMTDGSPLINIKKAIARIKADIVEMDVRIGVLDHAVLEAKLRDKTLLNAQIAA